MYSHTGVFSLFCLQKRLMWLRYGVCMYDCMSVWLYDCMIVWVYVMCVNFFDPTFRTHKYQNIMIWFGKKLYRPFQHDLRKGKFVKFRGSNILRPPNFVKFYIEIRRNYVEVYDYDELLETLLLLSRAQGCSWSIMVTPSS